MMDAQTRTKAKDFESVIRNKIVSKGHEATARAIGVDRTRVTRWMADDGMIAKVGRLLEFIEFDSQPQVVMFNAEDTTELTKALIDMLEHIREPKKAQAAATVQAEKTNKTVECTRYE